MKHSVLTLLFVRALAAAPRTTGHAPEMSRAEGSVDAMGSTYSIVAYGEDRDQLQSAVARRWKRPGGWINCFPTTGRTASGAR